ncbi:hypothetical protein D9756_009453 [Leucocoprinus leucothites]|uniref:Uncharacterized protein n=1 Tax=Leucocoprinus leucothites TaxID=201217 RepID=A0A8H5CW88_9AGAR|nr:hypothetical protein D9756_009453 [Leucoagaricus leucothites]
MPSHRNNEREVIDPITHLPLIIHDITDVELEQIPPPLSTAEERQRASAPVTHQHAYGFESPRTVETNLNHDKTSRLVYDLTHKGWWTDPGVDLERFRVQAAVVAGGAAGFGATVGLFSWWIVGFFFSRRNFTIVDLFILSLGCCFLGLAVGVAILSLRLVQPRPSQDSSNLQPGSSVRAKNDDIDSNAPSPSEQPSSTDPLSKETSLNDRDSPGWLNSLLRSVWPIVNPALFTSIADMLEDSLQHSLPKLIRGVRIADIGQGVEPVRILGIQFLAPGSASQSVHGLQAEEGDYMNIEVAFAYRSKPTTSTMGLKGRSANLHMLLEFYTSGGVQMPVWVELTGFLAMARARIQLTPNPPFVARMTLSFLGQPKVTMNCTPLAKNFLNVMDIPGLSGWLQRNVDSVIAEYVAPKSINLDLLSMLMGAPKMDVEALGVIVVTIRSASGFENADQTKILKTGENARKGDAYVTLGWSKWGKFLWATRKDKNPVWEETTAILVTPQELDAQESLRVQIWDADRFTADDLIGTVDVPLVGLMRSNETLNSITIREDQLHTDTRSAGSIPGKLLWECGYFEKTTLKQLIEHADESRRHNGGSLGALDGLGSYEEVKAGIEAEAEKKLREAKTREILDEQKGEDDAGVGLRFLDQTPASPAGNATGNGASPSSSEDKRTTSEVEQQKQEDLVSESNNLIASSPPSPYFPSGILSIRIEQISGLGVQNVRETGVKEAEDEDEDDLPSAYCEVVINHQRVYKTRTKMKSNNPFYDAKTEKFVRSWESTTLIICVRDSRLHERSPILGVAVLPLASIFRDKSYFRDTLPIVGGVGYGRLKVALIFRSVQVRLPKRLLGWDVGTVELNPRVFVIPSDALKENAGNEVYSKDSEVADDGNGKRKKGGTSGLVPGDLVGCRLVFRSRYSKGKMHPFHPSHHRSIPREHSKSLAPQPDPSALNTSACQASGSTSSVPRSVTAATSSTTPSSTASERLERAAEAEWRPKHRVYTHVDALKPLRLPILKRYASCIHILFRRSSPLGRDVTLARSVLWLKDISDEEEVVVQLPIMRERPSATTESPSASAPDCLARVQQKRRSLLDGSDGNNNANQHAESDGVVPGIMLVLRLRFWHGLSGYHQSLVSHGGNLEDVMEILDCAEDQEDISAGMVYGVPGATTAEDNTEEADMDGDDDLDSDDDGVNELSENSRDETNSEPDFTTPPQQGRTDSMSSQKLDFLADAQSQRKKPKESHRKHRGLMQWKYLREMAWVGHGIEHKAEKLGRKVKSGFKHQDRDAGVEKEV